MDPLARYRHGVDRAWQALAEWCCGKLQWQIPRRVLEPRMVPQQSRGEGDHRAVVTSLQRSTPSFEPRLFDTGRVRGRIEGARRTVQAGNGSDRCGMWGLCAPTRCVTVPRGALEARGEGSRLKLSVGRRIRASQPQRATRACWPPLSPRSNTHHRWRYVAVVSTFNNS